MRHRRSDGSASSDMPLIAAVGLLIIATGCSAGWVSGGKNDRPYAFVDTRPGAGELSPSFLCANSNGPLYYSDRGKSYIRRLNKRGSILEFNESHLGNGFAALWPAAYN